jgi:hypothetical protein
VILLFSFCSAMSMRLPLVSKGPINSVCSVEAWYGQPATWRILQCLGSPLTWRIYMTP